MKLDGKLSYDEIKQLIIEWELKIKENFIKNIYHWDGLWMFKLNKFRFVFEPGISLWPGDFEPREKNIHSVCVKLRKEIIDKKIVDFFVNTNDRTVFLKFSNNRFLCLELFAKGNLILCDENQKIMVLTRPNSFTNHKDLYSISPCINTEQKLSVWGWKKKNYEIIVSDDIPNQEYFSLSQGLEYLWDLKKIKLIKVPTDPNKNKINKFTVQQNIENQIHKFYQKINELDSFVKKEESLPNPDYHKINEIYTKIKSFQKKMMGAKNALSLIPSAPKPNKKKLKIILKNEKWYHQFIWWFSKQGILCIGGKNADQNEKIVKSYLKDHHLYFHSDEPGSGSFIYMIENNESEIDNVELEYTSQGVLSFSQNWKNNRPGKVYWVYGNQVSKTPESGEYVTKGSFIIRGTRNYISVHQLQLGYCLYNSDELMLGPYSLISKLKTKCLKLVPKSNTQKNSHKEIVKYLLQFLDIQKIPDTTYIFPYACIISTNNFCEK